MTTAPIIDVVLDEDVNAFRESALKGSYLAYRSGLTNVALNQAKLASICAELLKRRELQRVAQERFEAACNAAVTADNDPQQRLL